jgi:hypothetical protein
MANLITVPMTTWTDEIFLRAPGVTPQAVEQALYNTLRQFTKDSGAWIVELWDKASGDSTPQPFNLGADAPFYDFQSMIEVARQAAGGTYTSGVPTVAFDQFHTIDEYWPWEVLYVHQAAYFETYTYDTNPSDATQRATRMIFPQGTPAARVPSGGHQNVTGWPNRFRTYNERLGAIQILPTLQGNTAEKEGIVPWVSLGFPRVAVTDGIPQVFERMWYEDILDGTLFKLLSIQDKPWTNPTLAGYHGKKFRNSIAMARDMATRQFSNSETAWQFPAWA